MEEKHKKRKTISDKELLELIETELDCNEILNKIKVQKATLQKRVKNLMVSEKRFIEVEGLFPEPDEVEFKGRGIMIRKKRLEDSKFSSGDVFKITYNNDEIILSHIKRN